MAKNGLCEIIAIVDRSGSMAQIQSDAIGGLNAFINDQKKLPGEAKLTVVLFNHEYHLKYNGIDLQDAQDFDDTSCVPTGLTALLDAIGRTIDDVGSRLAKTAEGERPEKVIVGILTDGLENQSKDYTREQIMVRINRQQDTYEWEFLFLAANQDAIKEGMLIGLTADQAINFQYSAAGVTKAFTTFSETTASYRAGK